MREDIFLRFLVIFIHREIVYIAETESVLLDKIEPCAQFIPDPACALVGSCLGVSDKEDRIALCKACKFFKFILHVVRYELIDRSLVRHILKDFKVT